MAGKKAFDPQRVLERAMNAFWERGYEEGLYRLLIKAQVAGELAWRHDPHQLAHFLVGALVSLRVLARGQQDRRVLQDVVKTAVSVFD